MCFLIKIVFSFLYNSANRIFETKQSFIETICLYLLVKVSILPKLSTYKKLNRWHFCYFNTCLRFEGREQCLVELRYNYLNLESSSQIHNVFFFNNLFFGAGRKRIILSKIFWDTHLTFRMHVWQLHKRFHFSRNILYLKMCKIFGKLVFEMTLFSVWST